MKIVSIKQMTKIESNAILKGSLEDDFMEEAGLQIARLVHSYVERHDLKKQIVILAGKGNNGGDAYVAGCHLLTMGYSVDAMQLFPFGDCSPLCQINQTKFFNAGGFVKEIREEADFALPLNGLIIDGIFGTGFRGKTTALIASIIFKANYSKLPIIAVDIPSGLNGDTGIASEETIKARETGYLGLPKIGFFIREGFNYVGALNYIDFGLPLRVIEEVKTDFVMVEASLVKHLLPSIKRCSNKYERGFVACLAGSPGMAGAALLSSFAALKSGSGIVKLFYPLEMKDELVASPFELIKIPYELKNVKQILETFKKASALFLGPGIGREADTVKLLKKIIPFIQKPTVLDADALNILSLNKIKLPKEVILTPHQKEMERLLHLTENQTRDFTFLALCQDYAEKHQVTLILKGAPTFIFHPSTPVYVSIAGDPGMATAGSGDVLTGLLASLLAQGLGCHEAALLGTFLHGIAGQTAALENSSYCMTAGDLILHFKDAFKRLL